jgi:hypothetical protein
MRPGRSENNTRPRRRSWTRTACRGVRFQLLRNLGTISFGFLMRSAIYGRRLPDIRENSPRLRSGARGTRRTGRVLLGLDNASFHRVEHQLRRAMKAQGVHQARPVNGHRIDADIQ